MKDRKEKNVTIYTPESTLRHPLNLFRDMFRDLFAGRELAWRLCCKRHQRAVPTNSIGASLGFYTAISPYNNMDILKRLRNSQYPRNRPTLPCLCVFRHNAMGDIHGCCKCTTSTDDKRQTNACQD